MSLYRNIHAKRKRIAAGSGEKMRKVGSKGAPTAKAFKQAAKTAKKKPKRGKRLDKKKKFYSFPVSKKGALKKSALFFIFLPVSQVESCQVRHTDDPFHKFLVDFVDRITGLMIIFSHGCDKKGPGDILHGKGSMVASSRRCF